MQKKQEESCGGLFPRGELIQILVWLPVKSLLRFKSVSKSWHSLIESPFFIDLHTTTTFFNSSSSSDDKFGSFIILAAVDRYFTIHAFKSVREHALLMLSSESVSKSSVSVVPVSVPSGWWLSANPNYKLPPSCWVKEEEGDDYDDRVFKVDNYYSNDKDQQQQQVFKLDSLGIPACYRFNENFSSAEIVGSCHGIVCLFDRDDHQDVSLWNPATRQFRVLPKSLTVKCSDCCCVAVESDYRCAGANQILAFGYDVETKDYKVLLLTCFKSRLYRTLAAECRCRVQIYSLSTNSWRFLEGITCLPGSPIYHAHGHILYLNGSCFFIAYFLNTRNQRRFPENDRFIIKFDFTKETFTPMQLPDHHQDHELYLSSLGDKIAIFRESWFAKDSSNNNNYIWIKKHDPNFDPEIRVQVFQIWVWELKNEHKEIWTELDSFEIDYNYARPNDWMLPRGLSDDGKFVMLETTYSTGLAKQMKLYNLVTKEVKKNFLSCSSLMSKANAYKPSLVGINSCWKWRSCSSRSR